MEPSQTTAGADFEVLKMGALLHLSSIHQIIIKLRREIKFIKKEFQKTFHVKTITSIWNLTYLPRVSIAERLSSTILFRFEQYSPEVKSLS